MAASRSRAISSTLSVDKRATCSHRTEIKGWTERGCGRDQLTKGEHLRENLRLHSASPGRFTGSLLTVQESDK
jgi:hypothetical protein